MIAKGKFAKAAVFAGRKEKTSGGLTKAPQGIRGARFLLCGDVSQRALVG